MLTITRKCIDGMAIGINIIGSWDLKEWGGEIVLKQQHVAWKIYILCPGSKLEECETENIHYLRGLQREKYPHWTSRFQLEKKREEC